MYQSLNTSTCVNPFLEKAGAFHYTPFEFLDKLILWTPTYITHRRSKLKNAILLPIIVLGVLFSESKGTYYYLVESKHFDDDVEFTFSVKFVIITASILMLLLNLARLAFFTKKFPTISKADFECL